MDVRYPQQRSARRASQATPASERYVDEPARMQPRIHLHDKVWAVMHGQYEVLERQGRLANSSKSAPSLMTATVSACSRSNACLVSHTSRRTISPASQWVVIVSIARNSSETSTPDEVSAPIASPCWSHRFVAPRHIQRNLAGQSLSSSKTSMTGPVLMV